MSTDFKPGAQAGVRILKIIGIAVAILGGVAFVLYLLVLTVAWLQSDDTPQSTVVTPTAPPSSSSANSESQNERIPEGDLLRGLSGEYKGTIALDEAKFSGDATLVINEARFSLQGRRAEKRLSGRLTAKNMGEYVDLQLNFDERPQPVLGRSATSSIVTKANFIQAQLTSLSLRATLPADGPGWLIKNAPDEKHEVHFSSTNCPEHPYCKPVRRCRPCKP